MSIVEPSLGDPPSIGSPTLWVMISISSATSGILGATPALPYKIYSMYAKTSGSVLDESIIK